MGGRRVEDYGMVLEEVSLLHDANEVFLADFAVAVAVGFLDHFIEFFVSHILAKFFGYSLEVLEADFALLLGVEEFEGLLDFFNRISFSL